MRPLFFQKLTSIALGLALSTLGAACADTGEVPLPEPTPLVCGSVPAPAAAPTLLAEGNLSLAGGGPCADLVVRQATAGVQSQQLLRPGSDATLLAGPLRRFSPNGEFLVLGGPTQQRYEIASGVLTELFEGSGDVYFVRDRATPPRLITVACGESEVRVVDADGSVRTLVSDIVSCPAVAEHAPVILYQDGGGVLHRLDIDTGRDTPLPVIDYSDGQTTWPGSGRNDTLRLSSDGEVVVHHQQSWGGPRAWATATRTATGEVIGAVPDTDTGYRVEALPGGHQMLIETGFDLFVLDPDYEFYAYAGLKILFRLEGRRVLVWDETQNTVFVFNPETGLRSETIGEVGTRPQAQVSADLGHVLLWTRGECIDWSCVRMILHDVETEESRVIFDGDAEIRPRAVGNGGYAVLEGTFGRGGGGRADREIRIYDPAGTVIYEAQESWLGSFQPTAEAMYFTITSTTDFRSRLVRLDLQSGASEVLAAPVLDFRVAGDRLYDLRLADEMTGAGELYVRPL